MLRWRIDVLTPDNQVKRQWSKAVSIGPAVKGFGMKPLTKTEANRAAWENHLSKLDQNNRTPLSMMTVEQFVETKFQPGHVDLLKPAGRSHYKYMLPHALAAIGKMRLCDVRKEHVQYAINGILKKDVPPPPEPAEGKKTAAKKQWKPRKYSVQTAKHVRTVISAIFSYAESEGCFSGTNPAKHAKLPEMVTKQRHALSLQQVQAVYGKLKAPINDMMLFAVLTSMNIAEICGLRWRRVNLTDQWKVMDDEILPPRTLAVREQWYRGAFGSVKAKARRRNIPIPKLLMTVLKSMASEAQQDQDAVVFASRTGRPIDEHNAAKRHLKPAGESLGMPWLSWHVFRHTHSTLTKQIGLSDYDRMVLMGHGSIQMTDRYTHADVERQREALDQIGDLIIGDASGAVN